VDRISVIDNSEFSSLLSSKKKQDEYVRRLEERKVLMQTVLEAIDLSESACKITVLLNDKLADLHSKLEDVIRRCEK